MSKKDEKVFINTFDGEQPVYFMVGLLNKKQDGITTSEFKVFEFTAGRVYFELIDESLLCTYTPVLVRDAEKNMVKNTPQKVIEHLESFLPQLEGVKEKENIKKSLDGEVNRIKEKYNIK